jgi:hypothetical protein
MGVSAGRDMMKKKSPRSRKDARIDTLEYSKPAAGVCEGSRADVQQSEKFLASFIDEVVVSDSGAWPPSDCQRHRNGS